MSLSFAGKDHIGLRSGSAMISFQRPEIGFKFKQSNPTYVSPIQE
jgi:hypothetical protein